MVTTSPMKSTKKIKLYTKKHKNDAYYYDGAQSNNYQTQNFKENRTQTVSVRKK